MVAFANPVAGIIRPPGSPLIVGSFRVTATFAEHVASGRGPGLDIGNGKCGDPLLAMGRGKVTAAFKDAKGACVVRYALLDYPGYEAGIAHMPSIETAVGATFAEGTVIGHIGGSGGVPCHLHGGVKHNGVEIDWWPLLKQNGAVEDDELDPSFSPKPNRTVTVNKGARHRLSPEINSTNIAIASDPGGPLGFPLMGTVVGAAVNGNTVWYAYWRPETSKVYYLHTSTCGPETPWEQTSGHSDADLILAAKTAGYNAATDVSAMAAATAAKYPKP